MTLPSEPIDLDHCPIAGPSGLFISPGYGQHPDRVLKSWELIYVRTAILHIEENGVEYHLRPGESLLLPPHRRHRGLSDHPSKLSFYWIHFYLADRLLPTPLRLSQHVAIARPDWMVQLFHQYISDQTAGIATPTSADALLLLILNETTLTNAGPVAEPGNAVIQRAEEYISHRLQFGLTPGDVAGALDYSTTHLSRLFRRVHGVTLGEFIHKTQVAQARTLLHDSPLPMKQIASQCGFGDIGYFRRVFRRELGISPREYRNRFGRVHINRD